MDIEMAGSLYPTQRAATRAATETLARWLLADDDLRGAARGADDLRAAVTAQLLEPLTGPAEDLVIIALAAVDWAAVAARLEKQS